MKKFITIAAALLLAGFAAIAQPRAIGLRLGYGASVSYQHTLGENFLSVDLDAIGFQGIGATVTYDWLNPFNTKIPWNNKGQWNWYLGAGATAGALLYPVHTLDNFKDVNNNIYAGLVGRCGVEYEFWFPLQLALEYRPTLGAYFHSYKQIDTSTGAVLNSSREAGFFQGGLYANAISLCVRYKF